MSSAKRGGGKPPHEPGADADKAPAAGGGGIPSGKAGAGGRGHAASSSSSAGNGLAKAKAAAKAASVNVAALAARNLGGFVPNKVFVGGVPITCTEEQFKNYFEPFGAITKVELHALRGFGYITYESVEAVDACLEKYEDHYLCKKWVEVKRSIPRELIDAYEREQRRLQAEWDADKSSVFVTERSPKAETPLASSASTSTTLPAPERTASGASLPNGAVSAPKKGGPAAAASPAGSPATASPGVGGRPGAAGQGKGWGGGGGGWPALGGGAGGATPNSMAMKSRITQLKEMGFSEEVAKRVLSECVWDVNKAIDRLLTSEEFAAEAFGGGGGGDSSSAAPAAGEEASGESQALPQATFPAAASPAEASNTVDQQQKPTEFSPPSRQSRPATGSGSTTSPKPSETRTRAAGGTGSVAATGSPAQKTAQPPTSPSVAGVGEQTPASVKGSPIKGSAQQSPSSALAAAAASPVSASSSPAASRGGAEPVSFPSSSPTADSTPKKDGASTTKKGEKEKSPPKASAGSQSPSSASPKSQPHSAEQRKAPPSLPTASGKGATQAGKAGAPAATGSPSQGAAAATAASFVTEPADRKESDVPTPIVGGTQDSPSTKATSTAAGQAAASGATTVPAGPSEEEERATPSLPIATAGTPTAASTAPVVSAKLRKRIERVSQDWQSEDASQMSVSANEFINVWVDTGTEHGWIHAERRTGAAQVGWVPLSVLKTLSPVAPQRWMCAKATWQATDESNQCSMQQGLMVIVWVKSRTPEGWTYVEIERGDGTTKTGWCPVFCLDWNED